MVSAGLALAALCLAAVAALVVLRAADARADTRLRRRLEAATLPHTRRFDAAMLDGLPEPAARFFRFAIAPGTELRTVARLSMGGELSLGGRDAPMHALQILAAPHGFLWQVRLDGPTRVTGSDALDTMGNWSRFRLLDLVPVGRAGGNPDHLRSAFGRMVGEALFWTPAAFLPAAGAGWDAISWEAVGSDTTAVTVRHRGLTQRAEVTVDGAGRPSRVAFPRWSNENADRTYRLQSFGGDLSEFDRFDGYCLPTRVTGGNHYGTPDYDAFFRARVTAAAFL